MMIVRPSITYLAVTMHLGKVEAGLSGEIKMLSFHLLRGSRRKYVQYSTRCPSLIAPRCRLEECKHNPNNLPTTIARIPSNFPILHAADGRPASEGGCYRKHSTSRVRKHEPRGLPLIEHELIIPVRRACSSNPAPLNSSHGSVRLKAILKCGTLGAKPFFYYGF